MLAGWAVENSSSASYLMRWRNRCGWQSCVVQTGSGPPQDDPLPCGPAHQCECECPQMLKRSRHRHAPHHTASHEAEHVAAADVLQACTPAQTSSAHRQHGSLGVMTTAYSLTAATHEEVNRCGGTPSGHWAGTMLWQTKACIPPLIA